MRDRCSTCFWRRYARCTEGLALQCSRWIPGGQPNDLALSPTAQVFYRSGPLFWERYTSFRLSSLLSRIMFFIIPLLVALIPILGYAPRLYRWVYLRRIDQLHRALGRIERDLEQSTSRCTHDRESAGRTGSPPITLN